MAELHRSRGQKFVTLANLLHVSRETLRQTLDGCIEQGLVVRNPGYGHPMRPEYVVTKAGDRAGPPSAGLLESLRRHGVEDVGLRKWSLPVAVALESAARFSKVVDALPGLTARGAALALRDLDSTGLVERVVHAASRPPAVEYRLTRVGRSIVRSARHLSAALDR